MLSEEFRKTGFTNQCDNGIKFNRAPEQLTRSLKPKSLNQASTSKTNVWGTGIVMWSLVEALHGDHRLCWEEDPVYTPQAGGRREPTFTPEARS